MFNFRLDFFEDFLTEVLHGEDLVEDLLGLPLKFSLDEFLDSLARHALVLGFLAIIFLPLDGFLHFVGEVLRRLLNNLSLH